MSISYWRLRDRYYRIIGSICNSCDFVSFPKFYSCPKCHSVNIADKEMPRTGKLLSYTISYEAMPGFEAELPMIIGLIKLDNGVNIIAQIIDSNIDDIQINVRVKSMFRKINSDGSSGQIYYGYKFKVLNKGV